MGKRRYITFKVDEDLPDVAHLGSQGRATEPLGVRCGRCLRFTGFCCVCTCTLFQALAPPMLAVMEVAVLLLLLLLLPHHDAASPFSLTTFDFRSSLEDLVAFSCIRGAVISGTYTVGSKRYQLRGYLVSAYVVGAAGLAYALVKAALFAYEPQAWLRPAALLITFAVFSWLHILAARHTVLWARRRGQLGLAPQAPFSSLPGLRHSSSAGSLSEWDGDDASDVAPELLADPDSQFVDLNGLVVHFKEAAPPGPASPRTAQQQQQGMTAADALASAAAWIAAPADTARPGGGAEAAAAVPRDSAVVLVHGFGGGVFAWRHVMQPLAAAVGARVIAFDRPGFGLTARPDEGEPSAAAAAAAAGSCPPRAGVPASSSSRQRLQQPLLSDDVEQQLAGGPDAGAVSPYSLEGQALLTLRLCQALGLRRVVLAGHADGSLVVLQAAALATRMHATASSSRQQQQHHRHHRGGRANHAEAALETAVSADFSWMGSLAETNGEPQQQQQQQQHSSPAASSVSAGGAAAGGSGGGSRSQQDGSPSAAEGVHQQLREVQSAGEAGEEASPVSSISLQSMLQQGGGSSGSLQQQHSSSSYTAVSAAGSCAATAEAASGKAVAGAQQQQQQAGDGDWALQPPLLQPPMTGRQSELHAAAEHAAAGTCVHVCGLVLLHPNLSGHQVPAFTRLLAASSLGRSMLRPLLRTEVGEVTHRRAWHNPDLMTREVLALYRRPLRVVAWDAALLAASRAAGAVSPRAVAAQLAAVRHLPCLLVTGEQDRIATPGRVAALSARLSAAQTAVVPSCGHLSHEEAPQQLLQALAPACAAMLTRPVG